MPNKSKSRNSSRKSTASSQGKPTFVHNDEEYPSIAVVSSKKVTPKASRSEILETTLPPLPPPPPTPWELVGLSEEEYIERSMRSRKYFEESMKECYRESLLADWNSVAYWDDRLKFLERERETINKKRAWSALDCSYVDQLDAEIQECWDMLDSLYNEEERLEYEYD